MPPSSSFSDSSSSSSASTSTSSPKLSLSPTAAAQALSALSQLSKEDLKARRARIVAAVEVVTKGSERPARGQFKDRDNRAYCKKGNASNYFRRDRYDDGYEDRGSRDRLGGNERHERFDRRDHDSYKGRDDFKGRNLYAERNESERGERGSHFSGRERFFSSNRPRSQRQRRDFGQKRFSDHRFERTIIDVHNVFTSTVPVGQMVPLPVVELSDKGVMVDGAEFGKLFIPHSQVSQKLHLGDSLRVFIYQHSGRFLATAKRPYFELGMTGRLKVTSIEHDTVYLDLGIPKELVLPRSEQRRQFKVGDEALVLIAIDELGRLYASQCFNRFIRDTALPDEFAAQQKVKLVAVARTHLGYRAIVDNRVYGLIYNPKQYGELQIGKRYDGYVTAIRPDGRLNVSLQKCGRDGIEQDASSILQALFCSHGYLHFSDHSSPQEIEDYLHMSKVRFKNAIGSLYKDNMIVITDNGIEFTDKGMEYQQQRRLMGRAQAENDDGVASKEDEAERAGAVNVHEAGVAMAGNINVSDTACAVDALSAKTNIAEDGNIDDEDVDANKF